MTGGGLPIARSLSPAFSPQRMRTIFRAAAKDPASSRAT
jgi:hypothetical protein